MTVQMTSSDHKTWARIILFLIILKSVIKQAEAGGSCRPVYMCHGLFETSQFMDVMVARILKDYPDTDILNSDAYSAGRSLTPMWDQIYGDLGKEFLAFMAKHPNEEITMIGHSQGALLFRALCHVYCNHTVHTLILIAGMLRGGYGTATVFAPLIPLAQIPPFLDLQTFLYYKRKSQDKWSFTNYWNDPKHQKDYLKYNIFLPILNKEVPSNFSGCFKEGFTRLKKHVTIISPDDGIIIPYQSGEYSYFAEGDAYPAIVNFRDTEIYQKDLIGIRTLDETDRWDRYSFPGINHFEQVDSEKLYNEAILPYLDCKKTR